MRNLGSNVKLPKGWRFTRFDEFLKKIDRKIIIQDDVSYKCVGVRWYAMGAFVREHLLGMNIARKQQWIIKAGDVVYNKLFAWKGSFAIADESVNGCIVSDKFPTYEVDLEIIHPDFLRYYFRTPQLAQQAQDLSKGAAAISKLTLNPPQFWDLIIPLPPSEEQRRIVAKIDELAGKIEETLRLRHQATQEDEALTHSFMNQILTRAANIASWEFGPIPMFANVNPSRTGQIDLKPEDPVSFVPMKAVDDVTGKISWPEVRPFREVAKGYTWFKEGDVIFARITPCMQNGKAVIARNLVSGNGFGSTEFHVIRPGPKLLAEWLHSLVRHKAFREDATKTFKGTAGQQRVPQSFLDQRVIPVPPLSEQRQIIAEIDALRGKVDALNHLQTETAAEIGALLPSILDKAFKGEL